MDLSARRWYAAYIVSYFSGVQFASEAVESWRDVVCEVLLFSQYSTDWSIRRTDLVHCFPNPNYLMVGLRESIFQAGYLISLLRDSLKFDSVPEILFGFLNLLSGPIYLGEEEFYEIDNRGRLIRHNRRNLLLIDRLFVRLSVTIARETWVKLEGPFSVIVTEAGWIQGLSFYMGRPEHRRCRNRLGKTLLRLQLGDFFVGLCRMLPAFSGDLFRAPFEWYFHIFIASACICLKIYRIYRMFSNKMCCSITI